ncbi:SAM-dependent methyltransferase [Roseivirga sp. BDSF3-8]|uniref:SAM-dependent methyltransferase n=1 Tax=Roseivirga sp. BDSF3-8 TaxID=3241598 RepID=UPI00353222D9
MKEATLEKGTVYLIPSVLAPDSAPTVIPEQIRDVVRKTDYYLVENIRTARRYISSLKTGAVIESLEFNELDKKTPDHIVKKLLKPACEGRSIGIISEAGCPGVADPGARAVEEAHRLGLNVVPLTGPSSFLLALMASGFNGQSFEFHGYLPIKAGERKKALGKLENDSRRNRKTQIFMETPYRNDKMVESILANCQASTKLCIAVNISGSDEFIYSAPITEWKKLKRSFHKQPAVFLIYAGD